MAAVRDMEGDNVNLGGLSRNTTTSSSTATRTGVTTIDPADLILGEKLGAGSFGAVYRG